MQPPRFTVFPVTGYTIDGPIQRRLLPFRQRQREPITTWYVVDDLQCGAVIGEFAFEHEARNFRIRMAALDREYDKRQEREAVAGGNGRV